MKNLILSLVFTMSLFGFDSGLIEPKYVSEPDSFILNIDRIENKDKIFKLKTIYTQDKTKNLILNISTPLFIKKSTEENVDTDVFLKAIVQRLVSSEVLKIKYADNSNGIEHLKFYILEDNKFFYSLEIEVKTILETE